jgi:hypothetical protein
MGIAEASGEEQTSAKRRDSDQSMPINTGHGATQQNKAVLINLPRNRNPRQPQHVRHFRLFQPRSIVLKREMLSLVAHAKLPQSIRIREPAQIMELFIAQRRLQFVSNLDQCHSARNS